MPRVVRLGPNMDGNSTWSNSKLRAPSSPGSPTGSHLVNPRVPGRRRKTPHRLLRLTRGRQTSVLRVRQPHHWTWTHHYQQFTCQRRHRAQGQTRACVLRRTRSHSPTGQRPSPGIYCIEQGMISKAKSSLVLVLCAPVQRHDEIEFGPEGVALTGIDKEVLELCYVRL
jgi:hypothetical protein